MRVLAKGLELGDSSRNEVPIADAEDVAEEVILVALDAVNHLAEH